MRALLLRVLPVLDPHDFAEPAVRPSGDVAGGHDTGRGEARLVAHHAVVDVEPRALEPFGVRGRRRRRPPRRRPRRVVPSESTTPATRPLPSSTNASTPLDRRRSTPWSRCRSAHTAPIRSPSTRCSGTSSASSNVTSRPALASRRRDFGTDESGADDDDTRRHGFEVGAQREAVVERAQRVDPGEVGLPWQRADPRAGGDDESVERDRRSVLELDSRGRRGRGHAPGHRAATRHPCGRRRLRRGAGGRPPRCPRARASTAADGRTADAARPRSP